MTQCAVVSSYSMSSPPDSTLRSSAGLFVDRPLSRVTIYSGHVSASPTGLEHEQSDLRSTASKLSRRATFAPEVYDSMTTSLVQPSVSRQSSVTRQPSIIKQSSVLKQPSVVKQSSVAKQSSIVKQVSVVKQSSIGRQSSNGRPRSTNSARGQPFAKLQLSVPGDRSPPPKTTQPLTSKQSMDSPKGLRKRSSSSLHTLHSAKTIKIDDLLDDYKFAVERKAKPAEAAAGQHAQDLDAAMKNLTLNWIVKSFVSSCALSARPVFM